MNKDKDKKKYKDDDGRVIFDMSGLAAPRYKSERKAATDKDGLPTKKERRALIRAALSVYLPRFLFIILGFAAAMLLITLWLS